MLLLIASFGALSGLYVLLDAPFVAVTQIIVYAGAIMVLFLFVVMLLNAPREETVAPADLGAARADRHAARRGARGPACGRSGLGADASRDRLVHAGNLRRLGEFGRADRQLAVHATRVCVRSDLDPDPGGDGRRRGAGAEGNVTDGAAQPLPRPVGVLFAIGTAGVFLRRNLITILLSIEIMLNAVNLTFVAFGRTRDRWTGRSSCSS